MVEQEQVPERNKTQRVVDFKNRWAGRITEHLELYADTHQVYDPSPKIYGWRQRLIPFVTDNPRLLAFFQNREDKEWCRSKTKDCLRLQLSNDGGRTFRRVEVDIQDWSGYPEVAFVKVQANVVFVGAFTDPEQQRLEGRNWVDATGTTTGLNEVPSGMSYEKVLTVWSFPVERDQEIDRKVTATRLVGFALEDLQFPRSTLSQLPFPPPKLRIPDSAEYDRAIRYGFISSLKNRYPEWAAVQETMKLPFWTKYVNVRERLDHYGSFTPVGDDPVEWIDRSMGTP